MLDFLYTAVSWVLLRWHSLLTWMGLDPKSGLNWALSIILLVVTARVLLFRLFIKQVHYQQHMQEIQPKIQALREKYKNDKQEMQRQMMKLQQDQGFNPLSGCLPMVLQIPIFISLFHVLRHMSNSVSFCSGQYHGKLLHIYTFTTTQTCNAAQAKLFGAPLAGSLRDSASKIHDVLGGDVSSTRLVTAVLVVVSSAATFLTQLLVTRRATTTPVGTAATVQKLMKVFIPISVLVSGVIFPLGVLLYWFTSNVWTLLQQAYINRFHPAKPNDAPEVGAVGKTLAPRPGQRPAQVRSRVAPVSVDKAGDTDSLDSPSGTEEAAAAGAARPGAPRPGQRPNRPTGGKRPPGKRPSQAKKRR